VRLRHCARCWVESQARTTRRPSRRLAHRRSRRPQTADSGRSLPLDFKQLVAASPTTHDPYARFGNPIAVRHEAISSRLAISSTGADVSQTCSTPSMSSMRRREDRGWTDTGTRRADAMPAHCRMPRDVSEGMPLPVQQRR